MRFHKLVLVAATMSFAMAPTMAQASTCQPGGGGCVLPLPGPPAAPPPVTTPAPVDVGAPIIEEEAGFGALPFIIGALALAAIAAFFLLEEDEEEEDGGAPITP